MKKTLPELTIRFDERKRFLVIALSEKEGVRSKQKVRPFSIEWPIDELKTHTDLGERVIGAAVLAFFDRVAKGGLGLRNYRAEAEVDEDNIVADLQRLAKNKDASAQYSLAMLLLRRGAKEKSLKDVNEAEKWLKAAAKAGNKDASTYLKTDWLGARKAITSRIQSQ